jgi:uracil-DNA glycosylase family 4
MNSNRSSIERQLQQRLHSLRQAGVEWLPAAPPLEIAPEPSLPQIVEPTQTLFEVPQAVASAELTLDQRRQELKVLADRVAACTRCPELLSTRSRTVFADGPAGAELCFVGEAPGAEEDAQGKPFVGPAGQLLNRIIAACGLKREEVYICNIIKCRPPGNRTPKVEEAQHCSEYLTRQLELARPKFLCALGGCAAQNLLQTTDPVGRLRGRFHDYHGIPVLVTYHPSYLLPHRAPEKKPEVWKDMQLLMKRMGRTIPDKGK